MPRFRNRGTTIRAQSAHLLEFRAELARILGCEPTEAAIYRAAQDHAAVVSTVNEASKVHDEVLLPPQWLDRVLNQAAKCRGGE